MALIQELNTTVCNMIDLKYQAKNAHWNCSGALFYEFHLLFDRLYGEFDDLIDRLAERLVGMGGRVTGTIAQATSASLVPDQELSLTVATDFARDYRERLGVARVVNLSYINLANANNDQTTLNLLCELQEIYDTQDYLLGKSLA